MDTSQVTLLCFCLLAVTMEIWAIEFVEVDDDDKLSQLNNRATELPGKLIGIVVDHPGATPFSRLEYSLTQELKLNTNTIIFRLTKEKLPRDLFKAFKFSPITPLPVFYFEKYGQWLKYYFEAEPEDSTKMANKLKDIVKKFEVYDQMHVSAYVRWRNIGFAGKEEEAYVDFIFKQRRDFARQQAYADDDGIPDPSVPITRMKPLSSPEIQRPKPVSGWSGRPGWSGRSAWSGRSGGLNGPPGSGDSARLNGPAGSGRSAGLNGPPGSGDSPRLNGPAGSGGSARLNGPAGSGSSAKLGDPESWVSLPGRQSWMLERMALALETSATQARLQTIIMSNILSQLQTQQN